MNLDNSVSGYFEPACIHVFLPGCKNCGGAHPLARKPQRPADVCPDCGEPVEKPAEEVKVAAVVPGTSPTLWVARACLALGKALSNLSKRI